MDKFRMKRVKRERSPGGTPKPFGTCKYCGIRYDDSIYHAEVYDFCGHIKCKTCARSQTLVCEECEIEKESEPIAWYPADYPDYLKLTNLDLKLGKDQWTARVKRLNPAFKDFKTIPLFISNAATLYPLPPQPAPESESVENTDDVDTEEVSSGSDGVVEEERNITSPENDDEQSVPSSGEISSTCSSLTDPEEANDGIITVVDIRKITEDDDDEGNSSSSEDEPEVIPPPHIPFDPSTLKECRVMLRRVEEELKILGTAKYGDSNTTKVKVEPQPRQSTEDEDDDDEDDDDVVIIEPPVTRASARRESMMTQRVLREKRGSPDAKAPTQAPSKPSKAAASSRAKSVAKAKKQILKKRPTPRTATSSKSKNKKAPRKPRRKNPAKCPVCESVLSSNSNLKRHLHLVHSDVKQLLCKPCQLDFSRQDKYMEHIRTDSHKLQLGKN
ncbi:Zinc finger and BTB domain-containing protein 7A [Orchesella cincta]|uniref:Zinc finger and BTB domain-containing protein 7A n=1 Tax=Orchesella cincta TaxID=48709 RepID=A0A1D2MIT0_ORCCI|nr:Zinc finger and BTB domain-containing protein 7A [Orchesella cincta]